MTYLYTFQAFMGIVVMTNIVFTIAKVVLWLDTYDNYVKDYQHIKCNKDFKRHRNAFYISFFTLILAIISWTFIYSNHLIP